MGSRGAAAARRRLGMECVEVGGARLWQGDCRAVMGLLDSDSVHAVVCDPPYGLGFMGKGWDHGVPGVEFWAEALRVARPGAHLLAFGGSRTYHRLACAVEDAGWVLRDCIMWVYGSGFPKSLDVSRALDKALGAPRSNGGRIWEGGRRSAGMVKTKESEGTARRVIYDEAATDLAAQWAGWGTALKPGYEPIVVARKPLAGTVAESVMAWGVGGINVDGCRVPAFALGALRRGGPGCAEMGAGSDGLDRSGEASAGRRYCGVGGTDFAMLPGPRGGDARGRWPSNLVHDGSDWVSGHFPEAVSTGGMVPPDRRNVVAYGGGWSARPSASQGGFGDAGSAARYFPALGWEEGELEEVLYYCAKASTADREEGLEGMEALAQDPTRRPGDPGGENPRNRGAGLRRNHHPTVKPTALMRWLCRLVCPPGGVVLDPFMGSGSTGKAAVLEGFGFLGAELEAEYHGLAVARVRAAVERAALEAAAGVQGELF